jgi:hypothetical protein
MQITDESCALFESVVAARRKDLFKTGGKKTELRSTEVRPNS